MKQEKIINQYTEETRLALLEQSINSINDTMVRFEKRFDKIDEEMKSNFRWTLTFIGGLYLTIIGSLVTALFKFVH